MDIRALRWCRSVVASRRWYRRCTDSELKMTEYMSSGRCRIRTRGGLGGRGSVEDIVDDGQEGMKVRLMLKSGERTFVRTNFNWGATEVM